jgi:hypothetical protein
VVQKVRGFRMPFVQRELQYERSKDESGDHVGDEQQQINEALATKHDMMQCQIDTAPTHAMQGCGKRGRRSEHRNDFDSTQEELVPVNVSSWRTPDGEIVRKPYFGGLLRCNSNTGFCDCADRNAREHRQKLLRMMRRWMTMGKHLYFVTLTMSHEKFHSLQELELARQKGMYSVTNGSRWRTNKRDFGVAGRVTLIEATKGDSGWHPHVHMILFVDHEWGETEQREFGDAIFGRWSEGVMSLGIHKMARPSRARGIDVEHITTDSRLADIAEYAVKNQLVAAALEMTNSDAKEGRADGEAIKAIRQRHFEAWKSHGRYARHLKSGEIVVIEGSGAGRDFFIESPRDGDPVARSEMESYLLWSKERREKLVQAHSRFADDEDDETGLGDDDATAADRKEYRLKLIKIDDVIAEVVSVLAGDRPIFVDDYNFYLEGDLRRSGRLFVPDESKDYFEYCLTYQGMPMISVEYGSKDSSTELEAEWKRLLEYGNRDVPNWSDLPDVLEEYADSHDGYFEEDDSDIALRKSSTECEYLKTETPAYVLHRSFRTELNRDLGKQRMLLEAMAVSLAQFEIVANDLGVEYITAEEVNWLLYPNDDEDRRTAGNQAERGRWIRRAMPELVARRQDRLLRATNGVYQGLTPGREENDDERVRDRRQTKSSGRMRTERIDIGAALAPRTGASAPLRIRSASIENYRRPARPEVAD